MSSYLETAQALMRTPTAPTREHWMIETLDRLLAEIPVAGGSLDIRRDAWGNTFVRLRRGENPARTVAYVAHLDHPGFVPTEFDGKTVRGTFEGGVKTEFFVGTPVRFFRSPGDEGIRGVVTEIGEWDYATHNRQATFEVEEPADGAVLGMWDLVPERVEGNTLHSRAVDDLGGVALVLEALRRAAGRDEDVDFLAVFTRAEECGFRGALLIAEDAESRAMLPEDAWVISVETSSARPNTPIGGGGVLRVGDKSSIFDPDITRAIQDISEDLAKDKEMKPLVRALMDGGTCEATVFCLWGWRAGAVCLPLGNYHNMNVETGKIDAEYISLDDAEALAATMAELAFASPGEESGSARLRKRLQVLADGSAEKVGGRADRA